MPRIMLRDPQWARVVFLALVVCMLPAGISPEPAPAHQSPVKVGKVVRASHGVVVATHPDAARVGAEILRQRAMQWTRRWPRRPAQAAGY